MEVTLQKNDMVYLFSDGFADQFGGNYDKKYSYKKFRELLFSIKNLDLITQKNRIEEEFYHWKGNAEQIDDICILGVRI